MFNFVLLRKVNLLFSFVIISLIIKDLNAQKFFQMYANRKTNCELKK